MGGRSRAVKVWAILLVAVSAGASASVLGLGPGHAVLRADTSGPAPGGLGVGSIVPSGGPTHAQANLRALPDTTASKLADPTLLAPYVEDTLVLSNDTLVPGNFLATKSTLAPDFPGAIVYDSGKGELFVADESCGSPYLSPYYCTTTAQTVSVISDATNTVVATITVGPDPTGMAYDSGKGEVFVASSASDTVSVISDATNTVVATVAVGTVPEGVAYDSGKGEVFVANENSENVSVISDTTNTVVATIPVPVCLGWPYAYLIGAAYDPGKGEVFVTCPGNGVPYSNVSIISDTTNTVVANVGFEGDANAIAYDGRTAEVFVGGGEYGVVSVISATTDKVVASIGIESDFSNPWGIAYDSGKREVFVSQYVDPDYHYYFSMAVISDVNNTVVATVPVGDEPNAVAYDSGMGEIFVGDLSSNCVTVLSDASNTVVTSIPLTSVPLALAYDSGKREVFVANYGLLSSFTEYQASNVLVISETSNKVVAEVSAGELPDGLAYDSGKGQMFVADAGCTIIYGVCNYPGSNLDGNVSVISDSSNGVVATIAVGIRPSGLAYDPAKGEVFVLNSGSSNVSVINDTSDKVVATIALGTVASDGIEPNGLAYDPVKGEVFVANELSGNVSVISTSTDRVVASVAVGVRPSGVAYDGGLGEVFVTDNGSGVVSAISDVTNTVVASVAVGSSSDDVTYETGRGEVLVTNFSSNAVSVLADGAPAVVASVSTGGSPGAVVYDPATETIYVANAGDGSISILTWIAPVYPVTFTESGLPGGTSWSVTLNGSLSSSTGTTLTFGEPSGVYSYSIGSPAGFAPAEPSGVVTVSGGSVAVAVTFSKAYNATLTANSNILPSGKTWTLAIDGVVVNATGDSSATFLLPNGTYPYLLRGPAGYLVSGLAPAGNLTVHGSVVTANGEPLTTFTFGKGLTRSSVFSRTTVPAGDEWCVAVEAWRSCTTQGAVSLNDLTPGTYSYAISPLPGFTAKATMGGHSVPLSGWVTLTTRNVVFKVKFAPVLYTVAFDRTSLPSKLAWHVTVSCTTPKSGNVGCVGMKASGGGKGTGITLMLRNGTYDWTVKSIKGYELEYDGVVGWSGTLTVSGAVITLNVTIVRDPPVATPSGSGPPSMLLVARAARPAALER